MSRNTWVQGFSLGGAAVGQRFLGPYGPYYGGGAGYVVGNSTYSGMYGTRYYAPRYMGTQTATPYRIVAPYRRDFRVIESSATTASAIAPRVMTRPKSEPSQKAARQTRDIGYF